MKFLTGLSAIVLLSGPALAHPGHDLKEEIAERRDFLSTVKRADLSHCAEKLKARGVNERNVARRKALVEHARAKSRSLSAAEARYQENKRLLGVGGIAKRDLASVLATSHNSTSLGYSLNTDVATLFAGNNSCVLTPEVTQGPYCKLFLCAALLIAC